MRERYEPEGPVDEYQARLDWDQRVEEIVRPPILLGAAAMLEAASQRTSFLVDKRVPAGAITLFVGLPGAKKSWLAYDLALAVAQQRSWLGVPCTPKGPRPAALVLNYDNPRPECGRRFMRLGMQPDDPIFFHSVDLDPLRLPAAEAELRALVSHVRPSLIVVDSFRQAHVSDENSSQDMAIVMGHLKALYADGASVVIVHHAGKGGLAEGISKARGSGEISGSADAQVNVSWSDEHGCDIAHWEKHRSWELTPYEEVLGFELTDAGQLTALLPKELGGK